MVHVENLVFQDHADYFFDSPMWDWWEFYYFPVEMLTTIPHSTYYFSYRIHSMISTESEFWDYVGRLVYAQLFASWFWHETERGKRDYFVPG